LKQYDVNCFVQFLINLFGEEVAGEAVSRYPIATSKHWEGASVFWQIDTHGKVRTGKIMLYNPNTGKRVKEPFNHISWVHTALQLPAFELRQCFFGEHLLIDSTKPVAIVESEKTAIIASVYLPQFIWLAAGGKEGLTADKCKVLQGRIVILFPDINGFEKWSIKAKEFSFNISDLLEHKSTEAEREQGLDLADYLVEINYNNFVQPSKIIEQGTPVQPKEYSAASPPVATIYKKTEQPENVFNFVPKVEETWDNEIVELENYFIGIEPVTQTIKLNAWNNITDVPKFINNHFATIKNYNGNENFLPYLNRLYELKKLLTNKM
jgi:hypothetical protein